MTDNPASHRNSDGPEAETDMSDLQPPRHISTLPIAPFRTYGSNENTNRLLRQYFPKRTDLSVHSQTHLNKVACQLNEQPRKTLTFETPAERFNACVASTG